MVLPATYTLDAWSSDLYAKKAEIAFLETEYQIISFKDLRPGDFIRNQFNSRGQRDGNWSQTVVKENGKLGWKESNWGRETAEFRAFDTVKGIYDRMVEVRLPRAEPEVNEFGPVSP